MKFVIIFYSVYVEKDRLIYSRLKRHIYAWLFLVRHLTCFDCMEVAQQKICGSYSVFSYLQFFSFSSSFSCFRFKSVLSLKAELMFYCVLSIFFLQKFRTLIDYTTPNVWKHLRAIRRKYIYALGNTISPFVFHVPPEKFLVTSSCSFR